MSCFKKSPVTFSEAAAILRKCLHCYVHLYLIIEEYAVIFDQSLHGDFDKYLFS